MSLKDDLAGIVGQEFVSDAPEVLDRYSRDYSFVQPRRPRCVVYPQNTEEVQEVVKYANKYSIPVTPRSSGISFYGAGIPSQGGIVLDLTRMNKILEIDPRDRKVKVEPGVTWAQVQEEVAKHGMMVCNPLLPHPQKSVLTSTLEREPILVCKTEYNETLLTAEIVLGTGELFWTGTAVAKGMVGRSNPEAFILGTRLFKGAQGTLGVATWANIKAEFIPKMDKLFFIPFTRIEDLVEPIYRIQRRMLGNECFVLNNFDLAAILTEKGIDEFNALRERLPPWTVILCLSGLRRFPEGRIEYEEEALREVAAQLRFDVLPTVADIPGLGKKILSMLRQPWSQDGYWKFRYKGSCHEVFFHTTLDRVPEFTRAMAEVAVKYGYPTKDIGFYLQPIERARICFCQYGFHCDPNQAIDVDRVRRLYLEASEKAISMGGIFTTPYGSWADMVYSRAASYATVMKVVKNTFDPNNIMNPGKLCF